MSPVSPLTESYVPFGETEDPRLLALAKEYEAEWVTRGRPDRDVYLNRHPDIASALVDYLDGIDLLHQGAKALSGTIRPAAILDPGLTPGARLGEFELIREVGRGGMGIVYEAVQTSLNRRVAVKVLPASLSADRTRLQRFVVEAQAAAAVAHPNIVPVYSIGEAKGVSYYVMRLVDGGSLERVAPRIARSAAGHKASETRLDLSATGKDGVPMPAGGAPAAPDTALDHLLGLDRTDRAAYHRAIAGHGARIARALDHAHLCGVVHRDVKPANLLLDRDGHVWITDFGLAQFTDKPTVTRTGSAVGTLRYMSPEQAAGDRRRMDHRTDVYSLAVTLYELHTGRPAFDADSPTALLMRIALTDPTPPRQLDPAIPRDLETVLIKAMQKDPADRYATAADFAADLERVLAGEPIVARPPSAWDRVRKRAARHPRVVKLALVGLLALFGISWVAIGLVVAEQQRTKEANGKLEQANGDLRQANQEKEKARQVANDRADDLQRRFDRALALGDVVFKIGMTASNLSETAFRGPQRHLYLTALDIYGDLATLTQDQAKLAAVAALKKEVQDTIEKDDLRRDVERSFLLFHPDVRSELKFTPEQVAGLEKIVGRKVPADANNARWNINPSLIPARDKETLVLSLTREQRQRLRQVHVQYRGSRAFVDSDVLDDLEMTREQRGKVRMIYEKDRLAFDSSPLAYLGQINGKPPAAAERAAPSKVIERIKAEVLTEQQLKSWNELTGPPFQPRK